MPPERPTTRRAKREFDPLADDIVLVPPTPENIPGLTPRLALKRPGDRIYLGPKVAGRYTLGPVTDPKGTVVFFATGTGEAPHNAMVVELLRKGHMGPIVSAVTVRQMADLGYMDKNRELEARYPNFHYLPLPTREIGSEVCSDTRNINSINAILIAAPRSSPSALADRERSHREGPPRAPARAARCGSATR